MKKAIIRFFALMLTLGLTISSVQAFTPPGLNKKGGLPPGIQKKFLKETTINKTYETLLKGIDLENNRITIEDGTAVLMLLVDEKATIKLDDKKAQLDDLKVDDYIKIKLNKDNTVTEIKADSSERTKEIKATGHIHNLNLNKNKITLKEAGKNTTYEINDKVVVRIDGVTKGLKDLTVDMKATLWIMDKQVVAIEAKTTEYSTVTGTLAYINYTEKKLVVENKNGAKLYQLNDESLVYIDNKLKTLDDLTLEMKVTLQVNKSQVITLKAVSK